MKNTLRVLLLILLAMCAACENSSKSELNFDIISEDAEVQSAYKNCVTQMRSGLHKDNPGSEDLMDQVVPPEFQMKLCRGHLKSCLTDKTGWQCQGMIKEYNGTN